MKTAIVLLLLQTEKKELKKKPKNGSRLSALIIVVFAVITCFSLYMIASTLLNGRQEKNASDELTVPDVFAEYMEQVKAVANYDTGITTEYGDELITLFICSYHTTGGRAKKK